MEPSTFDPTHWKAEQLAAKPQLAFEAQDAEDARRWQAKLRRRVKARLGGFPAEKAALQARVLKRSEQGEYSQEEVVFTSRDGLEVFGYFLLPKNASGPLPTLLCLHGHGYGVNGLVGLDCNGEPHHDPDYHHSFAVQAVKRGYAVFAPELLGFGRRREGEIENSHQSSCQTLAGTALMLGQTLLGWRVYDTVRVLDYLETRPEVDTKRIGVMGISGGGANALFLSALDTRIKATVLSGYLNTFRDSICDIAHCIDNFVPGLFRDAEMSDIAGLIAPRALWCESGDADPIFPVASFRRALRDTKRIYKTLDANSKCGGEVFQGDHQFYGVGAWKFLAKHL